MTPDDVRDVFERALQARRDLDHMRARIEALSSPSLSSGIPQAISGGRSDPTGTAASALADGEEEMRRMEAECLSRIGQARRLVAGVRRGLGLTYGDVLHDRYVGGLTWAAVAMVNHISRTTTKRYRDVAFDWIASVGILRAEAGDMGLLADPRTT